MKETDFSSYADDNAPRKTADIIDKVIKCHLLVNKKDEVILNLRETEMKKSKDEKSPGIKVDTELNFNEHLNDIIS